MLFDKWFPASISTFSGDIDFVFYLIFYIVGFWFLLTEGLIIYSLIRHRKGKAAFFDGSGKRQSSWILIPAAVVLLLDLAIDYAGGQVYDKVKIETPDHIDLQVLVTDKQYGWFFTYPGEDNVLGTSDDIIFDEDAGAVPLHIPVGKVVQLHLKSADVIHSFFVPELRLKQDIVPGRIIPVWFQVTKKYLRKEPYEIACAELCGFGHHTMRAFLVVQTEEEFTGWLKEQAEEQW